MPSVSKKQFGFMGMSRTPKGRALLRAHGKEPAPVSVAKEFGRADKGRKISALPRIAKKKK